MSGSVKKILPIAFFILGLIALVAGDTLYLQARNIRQETDEKLQAASQQTQATASSTDIAKLLLELNATISKPGATLDDVNAFLTDKFGPCWGIPQGQCRE